SSRDERARIAAMALIDESTDFGARVARHLREEIVVWLTTVSPSGAPLPMPVWFVWDGADGVRIHSLDGARVRNLAANPRVTLNFGGDGHGGDIVVLSGEAHPARDAEPADIDTEYATKYADHMIRVAGSADAFAAKYRVPVHLHLTGLRGH